MDLSLQVNQEKAASLSLSVNVYTTAASLAATPWESSLEQGDLFFSLPYLESIERTSYPHIKPCYVIVSNESTAVALFYFQQVQFHGSKLINFIPDAMKNGLLKGCLSMLFNNINTSMMVLGNLLQTCDNGVRLLPNAANYSLPDLFSKVKEVVQKQRGTKLMLLCNCYESGNPWLKSMESLGFQHFYTEPDMQLKYPDQWQTFDAYMSALSSKYRVRAKKVLSDSAKLERRWLEAEWLEENKERVFQLNRNVMAHVKFSLGDIDVNYFHTLKQLLGNGFRVIGYFNEGELVGFCSCFVTGKQTYAHFLGLDYAFVHSGKIYNRILYDILEESINAKSSILEYGRTATEIKSTVGAQPLAMKAYLKHTNPLFNAVIRCFLTFLKPPEFVLREPFKTA
jgi:hypothetical protein